MLCIIQLSFLSPLSFISVAKIMKEITCQNKGKANQDFTIFMVGVIWSW